MKLFIYDEFSPEDMAMMQALYSRSASSVEDHVKKVQESGSGKFMERFYVGYGHASIADCGSTTLFIEGVSMLVAKAVQDWPLYSGQETSSRYIDMSKQAIVDPVGTAASKKILDQWMNFYVNSQAAVEAHLRQKYPKKPDEDQGVYDKAIKARVFDTLRAFLPAGVTTQLSWHTNLRQAHDKLSLLRYWPLAEVREVASTIRQLLVGKYAHSFGHQEFPEQEAYRKFATEKYTYYLPEKRFVQNLKKTKKKDASGFVGTTNIKKDELRAYAPAFKKRSQKTSLPLFLGELGTVTFQFLLDFGSFRDIQRHRNGVCRMPLLTTKFGFNEWYLSELSPALRISAKKLIAEQAKAIAALKASPENAQYYIAMGFNVACKVTYALPAAVYTMELRSGTLVHPSLRAIALKMCNYMKKTFPDLPLHADYSVDQWNVRRGLQDIREKSPGK